MAIHVYNESVEIYSTHSEMKYSNHELIFLFLFVNYCIVCTIISVLGIIANIINVIVFVQQGLQDTVNLTLFGLALSDLSSMIILLWMTICYNPHFQNSNIPFRFWEILYLTGDWPHCCFSRISGWMTALIVLERYLCISLPLKVKQIITPRLIKCCIVGVFFSHFILVVPVYMTVRLEWTSDGEDNRTQLGVVFVKNKEHVQLLISLVMNSIGLPCSMLVVLLCTIGVAVRLKDRHKWRLASAGNSSAADSVSKKDNKIVKMVILVAVIYLVCLTPVVIIVVSMTLEPELGVTGRYANIFLVCGSLVYTLLSLNSGTNIVVYYFMSTRFRESIASLFCKQ